MKMTIYFLDSYTCLLSVKYVRPIAVLVAENGISVSGSNSSRCCFVPLHKNTIGKVYIHISSIQLEITSNLICIRYDCLATTLEAYNSEQQICQRFGKATQHHQNLHSPQTTAGTHNMMRVWRYNPLGVCRLRNYQNLLLSLSANSTEKYCLVLCV